LLATKKYNYKLLSACFPRVSLAAWQIRPYVLDEPRRIAIMPDLVSSAAQWRMRSAVWAGVGALSAAAALLWVHYGSAVFFEMIAAGFASCF
jgi:hypothetical protein